MRGFQAPFSYMKEERNVIELYGSLEKKDTEKWRVVYTKPRQEKKLAEFAVKNKVNYYLPLIDSVRTYKYRKVTFKKPLFSGYIFIRCNLKQKDILIRSGHIVTFLQVDNENELLDDLNQIFLSLNHGANLIDHKYLEAGTKVKIIKGTFQGLNGYIENLNSKHEVILKVHMLQRAVSIKVLPEHVKIIHKTVED